MDFRPPAIAVAVILFFLVVSLCTARFRERLLKIISHQVISSVAPEDQARSFVLLIMLAMPIIVSITVLVSRLYVIIAHSYSIEDKKWAYGVVGTIIGYWLRGATSTI